MAVEALLAFFVFVDCIIGASLIVYIVLWAKNRGTKTNTDVYCDQTTNRLLGLIYDVLRRNSQGNTTKPNNGKNITKGKKGVKLPKDKEERTRIYYELEEEPAASDHETVIKAIDSMKLPENKLAEMPTPKEKIPAYIKSVIKTARMLGTEEKEQAETAPPSSAAPSEVSPTEESSVDGA